MLGDVHGAYRALEQVIARSDLDYENDEVICLGDVADGWPEVPQCFDELLKMKRLIYIIGNHDWWLLNWIKRGDQPREWLDQGGLATFEAYGRDPRRVPEAHRLLLQNAKGYYTTDDNKVFVHGGWEQGLGHPMEYQNNHLFWDRTLWKYALEVGTQALRKGETPRNITRFDEVYIGHTQTQQYSVDPVQACEVINVDQGAGWSGKLSLMDVDSKEYWSSDFVTDLYPGVRGRAEPYDNGLDSSKLRRGLFDNKGKQAVQG